MPSAPHTVADTLEPPGLACMARTDATWTFGRRPDEVPAARRFIREALDGHPAAHDAELLACELVTNTVQHAADAGWVTVAVSRRGAIVHVDVMDDGQTGLPHWREATGEDEGGRGFQLVNEIAQRWGFLRERARTCVWFELSPATR
jgi:histidine kinase-like protein